MKERELTSLSQWEGSSMSLSDFFLFEKYHERLYREARGLFEQTEAALKQGASPEKLFPEPIIQLSAKGLAIMLHLYAEKDKTDKQPLIASTKEDFERLVQLLANASVDTEVTVIFQPTDLKDEMAEFFSPFHKTVLKFKRTPAGLEMISMDSSNSDKYGRSALRWAQFALRKQARTSNSPEVLLFAGLQNNPQKEPVGSKIFLSRQTNHYECGVFALKDARQMNRDLNFMKKVIPENNTNEEFLYAIPPEYFKSIQSKTYYENAEVSKHSDSAVSKSGKTLAQHREKHGEN